MPDPTPKPLPPAVRRAVNRAAWAAGQRHAAVVAERLALRLRALAAAGATLDQLLAAVMDEQAL